MTEIEKKALALVNEVQAELEMPTHTMFHRNVNWANMTLCRAIEQHDAYRQEVSDAVKETLTALAAHGHCAEGSAHDRLSRFIITKPDPLVEALREALTRRHIVPSDEVMADEAAWLREALAKRGLQVTEIER